MGWTSTVTAITGSMCLAMGWMPLMRLYLLWSVGNSIGVYYGVRLRERPIILLNWAYLIMNVIGIARITLTHAH